ncbi:pyridoxamine 5'-phosphate oxidase family protein [soil metagenome]
MLGELNETQIDNLLLSQAIGRIACTNGTQPYIVPVTFMYDGKQIFGQTYEGTKLEIMRKNPNVCFQVDLMVNMANWQSVLVFGKFHELKGEAAIEARANLYEKVFPLLTSSTIHAHEHGVDTTVEDTSRIKPVMYRIHIDEKTGRFERQ